MGKTTAPLLSFDASGQIGKSLVYASWKGRAYARRHVIPANPNTAEQQLTRNTFRFLTNLFKFYPGSAIDAWNLYADSNRFTAMNGFIKLNNSPLREETDLLNITLSPSARSGLVAAGINLVAGSAQIEATLTAPDLPQGWTITNAYAAAVRNQNPQSESFWEITAGNDATSPYVITLTGLTPTEEYIVGGWFQYTRPDGTFAYGRSLQDTATPTA